MVPRCVVCYTLPNKLPEINKIGINNASTEVIGLFFNFQGSFVVVRDDDDDDDDDRTDERF